MHSWIRKTFIRCQALLIPGTANEYQPTILRSKSALLLGGVVFGIELFFFASSSLILPSAGFLASVFPDAVIELTNQNRTNLGESALTTSSLLEYAAHLKAQDMVQKGYFAHQSPDGKSPWYWLSQAGYKYEYAGENLAIHFFDSQYLMQAWLDSSSHKANILNSHYTETGVAVQQGTYEGKETVFIVQFFGKPASSSIAHATTTPSEPSAPTVEVAENVLGESTAPSKESKIPSILSSPKTMAQMAFSAIFALLLVAFLLNIGIHIQKQFPMLIANGIFLLLLISGFLILNGNLLLSKGNIL